MKAIIGHVYRWSLGPCSNGGVSDAFDTIYIVCEDGNYDVDTLDPNLVFVQEKRGPDYWALTPIIKKPNMIGPMFGGNLATGDSRAPYAYRIHDRWETTVLNDALSN